MKSRTLIIALGAALVLAACALPPIDQNLEPIPLATALRSNTLAGGYQADQNIDKSGYREFANARLCPYWGLASWRFFSRRPSATSSCRCW